MHDFLEAYQRQSLKLNSLYYTPTLSRVQYLGSLLQILSRNLPVMTRFRAYCALSCLLWHLMDYSSVLAQNGTLVVDVKYGIHIIIWLPSHGCQCL